jgi:hypothetical protein
MTISRMILMTWVLTLGLISCAVPPQMTLSEIKTTRFYRADKPSLYDQVRVFCRKEEYRLERIEMESGTILGHKRMTVAGDPGPASGTGATRQIIMHIRATPSAPGELETNVRFTFADYAGTLTKDDEGMLVSQYVALFDILDGAFAGK